MKWLVILLVLIPVNLALIPTEPETVCIILPFESEPPVEQAIQEAVVYLQKRNFNHFVLMAYAVDFTKKQVMVVVQGVYLVEARKESSWNSS